MLPTNIYLCKTQVTQTLLYENESRHQKKKKKKKFLANYIHKKQIEAYRRSDKHLPNFCVGSMSQH